MTDHQDLQGESEIGGFKITDNIKYLGMHYPNV